MPKQLGASFARYPSRSAIAEPGGGGACAVDAGRRACRPSFTRPDRLRDGGVGVRRRRRVDRHRRHRREHHRGRQRPVAEADPPGTQRRRGLRAVGAGRQAAGGTGPEETERRTRVGCYRFGEHPEKAEEAGTVARIAELRRASPGRKRVTMRKVAEALAASIFLFTSFSMRRATAVARYAQAKKPSLPHHCPNRDLLGFETSGVGYGDEIRSFLGPDLFSQPE